MVFFIVTFAYLINLFVLQKSVKTLFTVIRVKVALQGSLVQTELQDNKERLVFKVHLDRWVNLGQRVDLVNKGNQVFQEDQETRDRLDLQGYLDPPDNLDCRYNVNFN